MLTRFPISIIMSRNINFAHHKKIDEEVKMRYSFIMRNAAAVFLFLSMFIGVSGELSAQFIDNQDPVPFIMAGKGAPEPFDDYNILAYFCII